MADTWEIRKDGKTYVSSGLKNCGYQKSALKTLKEKGYSMFLNDKCVMQGDKPREGQE